MIHIDKILSAEKENAHIEAKAATGGVPQSMWETYSAFANTNGGVILLGVKEDTHSKKLIPVGVENPEKLISEIWNILHNAQKISENILLNENIYAINYRNMQLIVVEVPRAARQNRPVYLGRDMFTGTYRRSGEGDYRCKREEILAMLRDQTEEGVDSKVVESLMLEDLNAESLRGYRMMFSNRKPDHIWTKLSDEQFLHKIGAAKKGSDGCLHPTLAGLIFFGDFVTIMDELPNYFLDYRERMAADTRWSDRVCCSDGDWSGNIFDFYFRISVEDAIAGGISDARNAKIFNMFSLINVGERSGSGLCDIYSIWEENGFARPEIQELSDPARVVLTLEVESISNETINGKLQQIADLMLENPHITTAELMQSLQCSRATVARLIKELKEKGYLIREGSNKKGTWRIVKN